MSEEKKLNQDQLEAITYQGGPLLIIAGAGTGKTTVITERIKNLIIDRKISPGNILALTFTEKAAREMQDRVDVALPLGYANMWISTFHSFGDRILRNEIVNLGLSSHYSLLSEAEGIAFLKKHLAEYKLDYFRPLGNPNKYLSDLLKHFSRLKDENISPQDYLDWLAASDLQEKHDNTEEGIEDGDVNDLKKYQELAFAYSRYEELKNQNGFLDYGDLIYLLIRLFKHKPSILAKYQKQFTHLLVDEFQDTNHAQYELIELLAPANEKPNLTIVADDNQSIYKFRGASISNILDFNRDYPESKSLVLNKNYRSSQTILDRAYQLIKYNDPDTLEAKLGISKKLEKQRVVAEIDPEFYFFNRIESEADFVADKIQKLTTPTDTSSSSTNYSLLATNYSYRDFAILVRANNHADTFTQALVYKGIPFQFLGPSMLFHQSEIKDLIAYLKLLTDFTDSVAAYRVLSLKYFDLSGRSLAELNRLAKYEHLSLVEVCERADQLPLSDKDKASLAGFVTMFHRHLDLTKTESPGQLLYYFMQDTGMVAELIKEQNSEKSRNLNSFFTKIKAFEASHDDVSIYILSDYFDLATELNESPLASESDWVGNNAVNIITVHSAKGLEFPVVFMVSLVNARFPSNDRADKIPLPDGLVKEHLPEGDFHLQEERRLFYVGMTRARDQLFLTGSRYHSDEAKREKKPSAFVVEALGADVVKLAMEKSLGIDPKPAVNQLSFLDSFRSQSTTNYKQPTTHHQLTSLSPSQIDDFTRCPLKYYYKYVLTIPLPQPPAGIFGSVIHDTLKDFYDLVAKGESVSEKILLQLYEANWQTGGFDTASQRDSYHNQGANYLTGFFTRSFDPNRLPALMEQKFTVKITSKLKLTGRIDRVDLTENGIEIIDYKTGKPKTEKDLKKDSQLDLYALAVSLGALRQPGIFDRVFAPEQIIVSYYYFENQQKVSFTKTAKDLDKARDLVIDTADQIQDTDFHATPGKHCDFCEFKTLCDYWK